MQFFFQLKVHLKCSENGRLEKNKFRDTSGIIVEPNHENSKQRFGVGYEMVSNYPNLTNLTSMHQTLSILILKYVIPAYSQFHQHFTSRFLLA